jgi:hypothetical protein
VTAPQAAPSCVAPGRAHPPTDGAMLCSAHTSTLGQWLADIPALWDTLDAAPSMQATTGARGGTLASHRAPARIDVLVLRDPRSRERCAEDADGNHGRGVLEILHSWARVVREERALVDPGPVTVGSERALLVAHLLWTVQQPWCDELYADVRAAWTLLRAAHGLRAPKPAARCWVPQATGGLCGGPVWSDPGQAWCGDCRTVWTGMELLRISSVLQEAG